MRNPIRVGILGLGRIGRMHAGNIAAMKEFEIVRGVDPYLDEAVEQEMQELGIPCSREPEDVFSDASIDAVIICSITETHSEFIIRAARAGKDVFCEKPIDHDVDRILKALQAVKEAGVILQVGFMHRFDCHHGKVQSMIAGGDIGRLEVLKITSRDPAPPSMKYISESGGIYVDFMIHDFDMARFLAGSEVEEVSAVGSVLVDPAIGEAGDEEFPCMMVHNPESFWRLRESVGDEIIGINLDPSHLIAYGADPIAAARALKGAIYHVHGKDTRIERGMADAHGLCEWKDVHDTAARTWNYVAVGCGKDLQWWKEFFSVVRMCGYNGDVSLEMEDFTMSTEAGIATSVDALRQTISR